MSRHAGLDSLFLCSTHDLAAMHITLRLRLRQPNYGVSACRATIRLLILRRSGDRILTDGGLTATDEAAISHPHTTPEMRAQVPLPRPCLYSTCQAALTKSPTLQYMLSHTHLPHYTELQ